MEAPRPDRVRFANKLKSLRALNGMMTQEDLAQDSDVDVGLIQNYEQGKSLVKLEAIEKLAVALASIFLNLYETALRGIPTPFAISLASTSPYSAKNSRNTRSPLRD